ncbi:MAG TPA: aldo/keto reductase [Atribacteraceae bacterium]|nr:aldo/keto reductase [Atribacteraceae bacterium]
MNNVVLGQSGLLVSELSLGAMTFGRETDEATSLAMLNRYIDAGGNFIDTANVYANGRSEEILGRALVGRREEVVLASKVYFRTEPGPYGADVSRKAIFRALTSSLKRLQTDYIDLYQVHCWSNTVPLDEIMETLDSLVQRGMVRYLGCSNYAGWQIAQASAVAGCGGWSRFVSAQMQYSLVERNIEYEVVPACHACGLSVMAWGPLGGGFLSGKYRAGERPAEGRLPGQRKEYEDSWERRATEKNFKILALLEAAAKKYGKTVSQTALNWLLTRPGTIPILGVRTPQQLEDNLGCTGWTLADDDLKLLDRASLPPELYPYRFIDWANHLITE